MLMKIPIGVCAAYAIFSLGLMAIFVVEFWGDWSFNMLVPIAFACGFTMVATRRRAARKLVASRSSRGAIRRSP